MEGTFADLEVEKDFRRTFPEQQGSAVPDAAREVRTGRRNEHLVVVLCCDDVIVVVLFGSGSALNL